MFERVLHTVLTQTLKRVAERPKAMRAFLDSLPLDAAEVEPAAVAEIVRSFAAQRRPVIMGYARSDTEFPCWSIVLGGDNEDLRALGDEGADDAEDGTPEKTSVWNRMFQVLTYAKHPDVTLYLYELLMGILISVRLELLAKAGLDNLSTLGGTELSPDRIFLPEFLFVRATSLTAIGERRGIPFLLEERQPLRTKRATGLHVRDERAPPDGLYHGVTTYLGEED